MASPNTENYHVPGGSKWVINGELEYGPDAVITPPDNTPIKELTFEAGAIVTLDSETKTGNTATSTKQAVKVTTASLTTAAGATQDVVITNSNAVAGDFAFATVSGGTNTRNVIVLSTVVTSNTITVKLLNIEASNALNGTVVLDVHFQKKAAA